MALSNIKEFREFFLRAVQTISGAKKDQESNYPTKAKNASGVQKYNRFLKGHFPTEDVFSKLFNSLTFKLNPEDKATEGVQGLVKVATSAKIVAREDDPDFTLAVKPSQLPEVVAGSNVQVEVNLVESRQVYTINATAQEAGQDSTTITINEGALSTSSATEVVLGDSTINKSDLNVGTIIEFLIYVEKTIGDTYQLRLEVENADTGEGINNIMPLTEASDRIVIEGKIIVGYNHLAIKGEMQSLSSATGVVSEDRFAELVEYQVASQNVLIRLNSQKTVASNPIILKTFSNSITTK